MWGRYGVRALRNDLAHDSQESGKVWHRMFNEAMANLSAIGQWYPQTGQDTLRQSARPHTPITGIGKEVCETGPWLIKGTGKSDPQIHFFRRGVAWSPWGGGTWSVRGTTQVVLKLCSEMVLSSLNQSEAPSFIRIDITIRDLSRDASRAVLGSHIRFRNEPNEVHV